MRRFMSTILIALGVLTATLSLSGCLVVPPRDHGHVGRQDGSDHRHDRDRDRDHDHDHDHDGNHWH